MIGMTLCLGDVNGGSSLAATGLTGQIMAHALERRASDILIDPKDEASYTVRLRIDGILRFVRGLPLPRPCGASCARTRT